jgi:ABC-2 type transport system permease protein
VVVSAYSILLLSEVGIWNVLGFDRSAAQLYWLAPLKTVMALVAKNIAIACFVMLEVILIAGVCVLFRLPISLGLFIEAFLVCMVMLVFLTAIGNISSLRFPRPVDPNESWKRSAGSRFQVILIFLYPLLAFPFAFAYYAQQKWESDYAFYGVLGFTAAVAAIAYGFSLEKAARMAAEGKERILSALTQGGSPVSS